MLRVTDGHWHTHVFNSLDGNISLQETPAGSDLHKKNTTTLYYCDLQRTETNIILISAVTEQTKLNENKTKLDLNE